MKRYLLSALLILGLTALWAQDGKPCPGTPTVKDHEGNVYHTVQIGKQCWTRENMRAVTSPSTGTYLINDLPRTFSYSGKIAKWYGHDSTRYSPQNFGVLYNWNAAMDTFNVKYGETSINKSSMSSVKLTVTGHRRGICPKGWHIPTDAEWGELEQYTGICSDIDVFDNSQPWRGNHSILLAGGNAWSPSDKPETPGYNSANRNQSGFTATPAGYFRESAFGNLSYDAVFWTATQHYINYDEAYYRYLYFKRPSVGRTNYGKYYGFSVRCVKN